MTENSAVWWRLPAPDRLASIGVKARETILEKYDLAKLLPKHLDWIEGYTC
ncbi:MAG TPA: hypothetical protein VMV04_07390 [Thermodesulfobacteriota bacterium]|nr:hypothetical protein [Thermodesulfobacteriota bacterium]